LELGILIGLGLIGRRRARKGARLRREIRGFRCAIGAGRRLLRRLCTPVSTGCGGKARQRREFHMGYQGLACEKTSPPGGGIPALRFAFAVVGCMEAFPANSEKDDMCSTDF